MSGAFRYLHHVRRVWLIAGLILLSGAGAWIYHAFFAERANPSQAEYPLRGIDISAHNGEIDFAKLRDAGVRFAYVKATEGADFLDKRYVANCTGLSREGIALGAYHFFRFDKDGEMQAWNFLNALKGRKMQLPPAIDVEEWGNTDDPGRRLLQKVLRRMVWLMLEEGYEPIIYTNKNGYQRYVRDRFTDIPLWICSFTDPPMEGDAVPWTIWQFSHRGSIAGITGAVDCNTINPRDPLFGAVSGYGQ